MDLKSLVATEVGKAQADSLSKRKAKFTLNSQKLDITKANTGSLNIATKDLI